MQYISNVYLYHTDVSFLVHLNMDLPSCNTITMSLHISDFSSSWNRDRPSCGTNCIVSLHLYHNVFRTLPFKACILFTVNNFKHLNLVGSTWNFCYTKDFEAQKNLGTTVKYTISYMHAFHLVFMYISLWHK